MIKGGYIDAAIANTAVHYLSSLTVTTLHIDLNQFRMDLRSYMPYMKVGPCVTLKNFANVWVFESQQSLTYLVIDRRPVRSRRNRRGSLPNLRQWTL